MQRSDFMTVNGIFEYLNTLFPVETACGFDNVGILIGDGDSRVTRVLIALDCTLNIIKEAKEQGCELIVTHHPVIFDPLKSLTSGDVAYEAVKQGLSVICMHTNMDVGNGGVNHCLCEALGLSEVEGYTAQDGYLLSKGKISPISGNELASRIKEKLGFSVRYVDSGKKISNILVCSGSGGGFVNEIIPSDTDALITADVKHNHFLEAERLGVSLFDGGHFATEDVVIEPLKVKLSAQFSDVTFITVHHSPIRFI